jgi:hypothetical protein
MSSKGSEPAVAARTVAVKGSGGVSATVVVTVRRRHVWVSIQPPFTWEAILVPEKVDELMRILAQAQEAAREQSPPSPDVASLAAAHRRTGARVAGVERRSTGTVQDHR